MSDPAHAMQEERVLPEHPPVKDWLHDFDHTDPR